MDAIEQMRRLTLGCFLEFPEQEAQFKESDTEDEEDYCIGGYHLTKIGETLNNGRYRVLQKLGWGHFSTVWLGFDLKKEEHCAIKIQKADSHFADAARDEIKLLNALKKKGHVKSASVIEILDHFEHIGPHGRHVCLTFEVLSKSLLSLVKRFNHKGVPLPMVKVICRQVLEGLYYIHDKCGIIHTDIKPENILFTQHKSERKAMKMEARKAAQAMEAHRRKKEVGRTAGKELNETIYKPQSELAFSSSRVKIVDFGNACWTSNHFTNDIQTRQYRAPEVIMGWGYDTKADIWSFACLVFELITGDYLFDPQPGEDYCKDEDHIALMMELLGPLPAHLCHKRGSKQKMFNERGSLLHISELNFWSLRDVFREKYKIPVQDSDAMTNFLLPMLYFDPTRRASAKEQLNHSFVNEPETLISCRDGFQTRYMKETSKTRFSAKVER